MQEPNSQFKVIHNHLKVIRLNPFLGRLGYLNPKTNLGNKVGKDLMGEIHNILNILVNIIHTELHVIPTKHLHHNDIHPKDALPLNYLHHHFQTQTMK